MLYHFNESSNKKQFTVAERSDPKYDSRIALAERRRVSINRWAVEPRRWSMPWFFTVCCSSICVSQTMMFARFEIYCGFSLCTKYINMANWRRVYKWTRWVGCWDEHVPKILNQKTKIFCIALKMSKWKLKKKSLDSNEKENVLKLSLQIVVRLNIFE